MATYQDRNKTLKSMGYKTYDLYLSSRVWWYIRQRVMTRDRGMCQICPRKATVVHHLNYSLTTLSGNDDDGLISLCGHCHGKIEFDRKGNKRSLSAVQRRYQELKGMR